MDKKPDSHLVVVENANPDIEVDGRASALYKELWAVIERERYANLSSLEIMSVLDIMKDTYKNYVRPYIVDGD